MNWKSTSVPSQIISNNSIIRKASQIAKEINTFFQRKILDIRSELNVLEWCPRICTNIMKIKKTKLLIQHVTERNIRKIR